jgi:hypothetical protein
LTDCPALAEPAVFRYQRVERPEDLPASERQIVDVALLDMNHGWPNLGHDALVYAIRDAVCHLTPDLAPSGLSVRVLSYDVRRGGVLPEPPDGRFSLYLGSGGPGHIDPEKNDGVSPGCQGVREDPGWKAPLFRLFDALAESPEAALFAVCHSFGVMCLWAGVARPVLRGADKGGKASGVLENVLSPEGAAHPWFRRFAARLPGDRRLRVLENRLFDLIPETPFPPGALPIGWDTRGVGGPPGDAITMLEFARDREGVMPRIFAVNHHPEIVDRGRQLLLLRQKLERGEVTREWFAERERVLTQSYPEEDSDERMHLTSDYTLLAPLRFYLYRQIRLRAEALGRRLALDERSVVENAA